MSQPLSCPNCRATLRVESLGAGQTFSCPKCQHSWIPLPRAAGAKKAVRILDAEEMASPAADNEPTRSKKKRSGQAVAPPKPLLLVGVVAGGVFVISVIALVGWLLMRPVERTVPGDGDVSTLTTSPVNTNATSPKANVRPKNEALFQKMLAATVMVLVEHPVDREQSFLSAGSGVIVNRQRRLLLTTNRATQANDRVAVVFPSRKANDELYTDLKYYLDNVKSLSIPGKVVSRNPQSDLALVEVERLPAAADELKLASYPIVTGGEIASIGASDVTVSSGAGTLWQYSSGTVQRRFKGITTFPDQQSLNAMVIESNKRLSGGDSGGPTVNTVGELVGLAFVNPSARDTHLFDLDLLELQEFLKTHASRAGWIWGAPSVAAPVTPTTSLPMTPAARLAALAAAVEQGSPDQKVTSIRDLATFGQDARKVVPKLIPMLDDSDARVREAVSAALETIGEPLPEDVGCLGKALAGSGPQARAHALRVYGTTQRLPDDLLPMVVGWLGSDAPEIRAQAAAVLARYGPECKAEALKPLSLMAIDENATVADAAVAALMKLAPYRGADFRWLTERANSQNARVRRFVIGQIGADAETVEVAATYLTPALNDADARVREVAVFRFARWGKSALPHVESSVLLKLMEDSDSAVRLAAIRTAGAVEAQQAFPKLLAVMKGEAKEAREAAAEAVANLDLTDPTHGSSAIDLLLLSDTPMALVKTCEKLASVKLMTKERVPAVGKILTRPEPAVRMAALTALASAGTAGSSQAEAVAELIVDDDAKLTEQALETLVRFGKSAAEAMAKRLDQKSNSAVKAQICRALGRYGTETPTVVVVYLIAEAEKNQELRDEVADAVEAISTNDTVTQLRPLVSWSLNARRQRTSKHPQDLQVWALRTMARLDPNKLSETERKRLMDGLKNQSDVDPDATCRREAGTALTKLKAKVKTPAK